MKNRGLAHMGIGRSKGENKTAEAVRQAVCSPLLETTIQGATGVIINVKGGLDLPLDEVYQAADMVREVVDPNCNIIFGSGIDESFNDEVEITIIATGFQADNQHEEEKNLNKVKQNVEAVNNFSNRRYEGFPISRGTGVNNQANNFTSEQNVQNDPFFRPERRQDVSMTQETSVRHEEPQQTSRLQVEDNDIPPYLRKLREHR